MKDKGISRDIGGRGAGAKRVAGDAPALGQVSRMSKASEHPGGRRRRRRVAEDDVVHRKSRQRPRSVMLLWTFTFGLLGVGLMAGVFFLWLKPIVDEREKRTAEANRPGQLMPVAAPVILQSIGEREAIEVAKRALKVRTSGEVNEVILPGAASESEVVAFLTNLKDIDGEIVRYEWVSRLDTTRPDIEGVLVTFKKGDLTRNRLALIVPDDRGEWKMDFPAFARLAVPAWNQLIEGKVDSAVVRVYLAADQYYNGAFKESEGWRCYGIASPDLPELLFGYCKADSDQGRAAFQLLMDGKKLSRATLEIERVEGAEKRQFLIKRVLAQDWAIGPKAFDEE